jgi:3-oxoacyl-ACP reductase-like protein
VTDAPGARQRTVPREVRAYAATVPAAGGGVAAARSCRDRYQAAGRGRHQAPRLGRMDLKLAGKIAVVTGASKGIGLAVVRALVEEGARVARA